MRILLRLTPLLLALVLAGCDKTIREARAPAPDPIAPLHVDASMR
jgi:hypothetical protein